MTRTFGRSTSILALVTALALGASAFAQDGEVSGESVYQTNCVACHQANGQGIPSAFPPLAEGHVPNILAVEGGRQYLIDVLLYGLTGQITVQGSTYNGAMPAWQQLSNEQIAAVLNYTATAWGNQPPEGFAEFTAEDIAAQRDQGLSPSQVHEMRQELPLGSSDAQ